MSDVCEWMKKYSLMINLLMVVVMTAIVIIGNFMGTFDSINSSATMIKIVSVLRYVIGGIFVASIVLQVVSIGINLSGNHKNGTFLMIANGVISATLFVITNVILTNVALISAVELAIVFANLTLFQYARELREM